jgi:hypothetical protein
MNPVCVVSDRYKFIYVFLPKNASSTLRHEFKDGRYGPAYEVDYSAVDENKKNEYFTFTVLREPVSRFLSAYQEVSMRYEGSDKGNIDYDYYSMDDTEQRINGFLDSIWHNQWDMYLEKQCEVLKNIRFDYFVGMEWLQQDMEAIYRQLGMGKCPGFLRHCSRLGRQQEQNYSKYFWNEEDLSKPTIKRILSLYREDLELYKKQIIDRYVVEGSFLERFKIKNQECFRYLVYHLGNRGLFAEISTVARAMMYALATGRQLILDSSEFSYRFEQGWQDYFEPFCGTYDPLLTQADYEHCYSNVRGPGTVFNKVLGYNPDMFQFDGLPMRDFLTALGSFTHAIFCLNSEVKGEIAIKSENIGLPKAYAAVHIRRGDKVGDEDIFYPFHLYWQKLQELGVGDLPLFVLSDDYQAVVEARQWLSSMNIDKAVYTLCDETHTV